MESSIKFSFWDLETTGLNKYFDIPLEVAFITTDADLNVCGELVLSCRPPGHVLPSPRALLITGVGIRELLARRMSGYEMVREVQAHVQALAPTCFAAFNGIAYDDEVARHTFYRNLHDPYQMQKHGNTRLDLLLMAHVAYVLRPDSITVPVAENGKLTFKLQGLASANGFSETGAHDALVDSRATLHLARFIRDQIPDLWQLATGTWNRKRAVNEMLSSSEVIVLVGWNARYGQPIIKALAPLAANPQYAGEFGCFDLSFDLDRYLDLSAEELVDEICCGPRARPICPIKMNAMPAIFDPGHPLVASCLPAPATELMARARAVRGHPEFVNRLAQALDLRRRQFSEPDYVEQKLYSGGFISDADSAKLERFHAASPGDKLGVLAKLEDERLRVLGRRLIFSEWPEVIPAREREELEKELRARVHSNYDVPWTTVPKALEEIAKLKGEAEGDQLALLEEYDTFLLSVPPLLSAAE